MNNIYIRTFTLLCQKMIKSSNTFNEPVKNCSICVRLKTFRQINRKKYPDFFNAPVPSLGQFGASLMIVGLAPGLKGANQTGRPFTGDHAGELLYSTLVKFGFAKGNYTDLKNKGFRLVNCRITNAVRCVPPKNRPISSEVLSCGTYLSREFLSMPNLRVILALGGIAHGAILSCFDQQKSLKKFSHQSKFELKAGLTLISSYHCSRYNTNTGRLTKDMFENVFRDIQRLLLSS